MIVADLKKVTFQLSVKRMNNVGKSYMQPFSYYRIITCPARTIETKKGLFLLVNTLSL